MWSIGAISALLLSGDVVFVDRDLPNFEYDRFEIIMELASKCDLSVIDDKRNPYWATVGRRPKSFVKSLLVLDEQVRLSARGALKHPWLSDPQWYAQLDAVYHKAISPWERQRQKKCRVQHIDTSRLKKSPLDSAAEVVYDRLKELKEVRSTYFAGHRGEERNEPRDSVME